MSVRGKSRHELFVGVCLSLGITFVVFSLYFIDGFEWLERRTYDLRMQYRGAIDLDTSVLMIENDESTMTKLGIPPSNVSRFHYAQAISNLRASGATLIAFDLLFSGRTDSSEDAVLSQAIRDAGNVVLARYIGGVDHVRPWEEFQRHELGEGLINLSLDSDGVLRSIPFLGIGYENAQIRPFMTLGAEVARLYIDTDGQFPLDVATPDVAKFGPIEIPYPQGQMFINFYGPPGTFPSMPLWRAVTGEFDADMVKGKIVLIGGTAATLHDYYQTPFVRGKMDSLQQSHARTEGRLMAGLEVHANVVQTVLDQSFVQRSSPLTVSLMIIMLGLGCWIFIIVYPNNAIQVSGLSLLFLVFIVGLCVLLFIQGQYWLDVMPLLSVVNVHYGIGMAYQRYLVSRQKERLRSMFSQYLSPEVAEHLWNARGDLLQGSSQRPENLTVTTLAAGFDGFETMGNVEPDRILVWATDYLDEIGRLIIHYQGIVEDYTQDGILVHFGVLASRGSEGELCHDVRNAVGCAMAIHLALEKINAKWKDEHLPLLQVHAGICTGRAMTTTVGGRGRLKFATLGRPVWMALSLKRLAVSLSKDLGTPNIFCETETAQYLEKSFITRQVREIHSDTNTHSSMPYQILANVPMTSI